MKKIYFVFILALLLASCTTQKLSREEEDKILNSRVLRDESQCASILREQKIMGGNEGLKNLKVQKGYHSDSRVPGQF